MCGIAGIYHFGRSDPIDRELLCRIRDVMAHRGPDDEGCWTEPDHSIGLAHRRLSIVDLSPDGRQPMANEDESVWVTFNGEIYNHAEWRARLESEGHRFRSRSDTEVILHLYEKFGTDCVKHIDGMFAFAVWDRPARRLLLARDRLGVKPLYYVQHNGMLLFASEIKALLAHPEVPRELDRESLGLYLALKTVPAPGTMFAGVRKVPAGAVLVCDAGGPRPPCHYWDVVTAERPMSGRLDEHAAVERVRTLLNESIAKRLMADVPIGVFLSGGLDSSAIVALMAPMASGPLNTFSAGIADVPGCNEFEFALTVSKRFGTNHQEVSVGSREVADYLSELAYSQDEPLADPVCVPLYYLSKLARRSGVKVVLVGEGSDEQFLGYDSRINFLRRYQRTWARLLAMPRAARRALEAVVDAVHRSTGLAGRAARVLASATRGDTPFLGSQAFGAEDLERVLEGPVRDGREGAMRAVRRALEPLLAAWPAAEIASRMAYIDLKIRLAELLLMRVDKITMSVGLEAREPFLDYRLCEFLMTVPMSQKLPNWEAKYLLKRAVEDVVPENIIRRPKQPFAAPVAEWIRGGLADFARDTILHSSLRRLGLFNYPAIEQMLEEHVSGRRNHDVRLWNLMNLSAWYDRYFPA
jgi:asparagine synthase (glutamine-hydrolysing)